MTFEIPKTYVDYLIKRIKMPIEEIVTQEIKGCGYSLTYQYKVKEKGKVNTFIVNHLFSKDSNKIKLEVVNMDYYFPRKTAALYIDNLQKILKENSPANPKLDFGPTKNGKSSFKLRIDIEVVEPFLASDLYIDTEWLVNVLYRIICDIRNAKALTTHSA